MKKNPYYHCHEGEQLSASRVELLVLPPALMDETFRKGGIDLLDTNLINPDAVDRICSSDRWKDRMIARSRVEIQYLMMNVDEAPLRDVRIRRAVQMAIKRQAILEELYGGDGCLTDGIFPRGLIGYNEENQGWLQYDPKEAKRLVSEVPDAGKIRLELAANTENGTRKLTMLEMIRQDLIEACNIDGASLWQQILNVDLPTIRPIMVVQFILSAGQIMSIGFEKALALQTDLNRAASEIIPTYVYSLGLQIGDYGYSTAVGLFNSIINVILLLTVNAVVKRLNEGERL